MKKNVFLAILLIGGVSITSCKREGCTDSTANNYDESAKKDDGSCTYDNIAPSTASLELHVHHYVGTEAFSYDSVYTDAAGNDYQFTLARVYLSNPRFTDMSGTTVQTPASYAMVEPGTMHYDFGTLDPGHLHNMYLQIGVDSTTNHEDPAMYSAGHPLAFATPSNHWGWSSGYRFISLEGNVDTDNDGTMDTTFIMHIGTDALFREHNAIMTMLDVEAGDQETIHLAINWGQFLAGIDLETDNLTHTMNNMPLATTVANNSVSAISLD